MQNQKQCNQLAWCIQFLPLYSGLAGLEKMSSTVDLVNFTVQYIIRCYPQNRQNKHCIDCSAQEGPQSKI